MKHYKQEKFFIGTFQLNLLHSLHIVDSFYKSIDFFNKYLKLRFPMNVQPRFSSTFTANTDPQFSSGVAASSASVSNPIANGEFHQADRQEDTNRMYAMPAHGGGAAAAAAAPNQRYLDSLNQAAGPAPMFPRVTGATYDQGAAAAASISGHISRTDPYAQAIQASMIRMNAMPARSEGAAAAAASFVSNQRYPSALHQAARQAEMVLMNATRARSEGAAAAACASATPVSYQNYRSDLLLTDLVSHRISFNEFLAIATKADIDRVLEMTSVGKYVNALAPGGDPKWVSVFFGVVFARTDVLSELFEGNPNAAAAQQAATVTPSQAAARANAVTQDGCTALMVAAKSGNAEIVEMLRKAGARVDDRDANGTNALMWAAASGNLDAVSALLKSHPTFNCVNNQGITALLAAAGKGNIPMAKLLSSAGEDIHANLFRTIQDGTYTLGSAYTLLQAGADPNTSIEGCTVMMLAAQRGDTVLMGALLTAGAQLPPAVMIQLCGPMELAGNTLAAAGSNASLSLAQDNQTGMPAPLPQSAQLPQSPQLPQLPQLPQAEGQLFHGEDPQPLDGNRMVDDFLN